MSLKIINFETAIYVGESEDIESHCNSILQEIKDPKDFLKMRSVVMNYRKEHLKPKVNKN